VNREAILRRTHRIHGWPSTRGTGNESRINEEGANLTDTPTSRALTPARPPHYVAGTGLSDTPSKGNIAAGHITQPST
jgi:hypothetical protein